MERSFEEPITFWVLFYHIPKVLLMNYVSSWLISRSFFSQLTRKCRYTELPSMLSTLIQMQKKEPDSYSILSNNLLITFFKYLLCHVKLYMNEDQKNTKVTTVWLWKESIYFKDPTILPSNPKSLSNLRPWEAYSPSLPNSFSQIYQNLLTVLTVLQSFQSKS